MAQDPQHLLQLAERLGLVDHEDAARLRDGPQPRPGPGEELGCWLGLPPEMIEALRLIASGLGAPDAPEEPALSDLPSTLGEPTLRVPSRRATEPRDTIRPRSPGDGDEKTVLDSRSTGRAANAPDRLGRYSVTGLLGEGGMGQVLQVRDEDLGREIAAKVIKGRADPGVRDKFIREAQVTGQLEHPNIVPTYELGRTVEGQIYFTMKRIEGHDLSARLRPGTRGDGVTLLDDLQILLKVCDALALAHSKGVIHRDLKPSNIMVGPFGEVQVMDWGLARVMGQPPPTPGGGALDLDSGRFEVQTGAADRLEPLQTLDGMVVGTPCYMPPEQARGEVSALDQRADVYALGAILYQMLTGQPPFVDSSTERVLAQVRTGTLIRPSERTPERTIPWELEVVALKAMAADVEQRYQDVGQLKRDIEAFLSGRVLQAVDYQGWQVLRKWASRNRPAVAATAGVLLSGIIALIGVYRHLGVAQQATARAQREQGKAADARRRAQARRIQAQDSERRALARQRDFNQLADVQNLRDLRRAAGLLWPRRPDKIARLEGWLRTAGALVDNLEDHQRTITRLAGLDRTQAQTVLHRALTELVRELARLRDGSRYGDTIPGIRWRLQFARALARRDDQAAWRGAIAAISREPLYQGLVVEPVEGLLPLGPDPTSRLWEFAHLGSGKPARRVNGTLEVGPHTGLVLVLLPPGTFMMGAQRGKGPNLDPRAQASEGPVRSVTLAPFYLSKYEMTQAQWKQLTGVNPSQFLPGKRYGGRTIRWRNPVERVNWEECTLQLRRIGLVLPTEAQWEYAARAGTHSIWPGANSITELQGHANIADRTAKRFSQWSCVLELVDGHVVHAPVGSFLPNRWGLFDVTGNVLEWCRDHSTKSYWTPASDGDGLRVNPNSRFRVCRGGAFLSHDATARVAFRDGKSPVTRYDALGLRPALNLTR